MHPAGNYNDAKETERDIVTVDENGTALTKLLPYGTYTVREIGEDGEVLSDSFKASIIEDKTYVYTSDGELEEKPESTATPAPTEEPTAPAGAFCTPAPTAAAYGRPHGSTHGSTYGNTHSGSYSNAYDSAHCNAYADIFHAENRQ